jgi:hypothetical protein
MRDPITMPQERIDYLRGELEAERISMGELIEIQGEFEKIPEKDLPEPAENAMASDMLDEIEARSVDTAKRLIVEVDLAVKVSEGEIINLDAAIRWNRGHFEADEDGGTLSISEGERNFDTFGYMTECCMALVSLPEGVDESW